MLKVLQKTYLLSLILLMACISHPQTVSAHKKHNGNYYIVKRGDTLYSIARNYKVNPNSLAALNHLKSENHIEMGTKLLIPRNNTVAKKTIIHPVTNVAKNSSPSTILRIDAAPSKPKPQTSNPQLKDVAEKPDNKILSTSSSVATSTTSSTDPIVEWQKTYDLTNFDTKPKSEKKSSTNNSASSIKTASAATKEDDLGEDNLDRDNNDSADNISKTKIVNSTHPSNTNLAKSSIIPSSGNNLAFGKNLIWPVTGRIIARFGPRAGGLYNDGINISAPDGSKIMAADDGIVVYSGNELRGYGNLVLVKHNNGYLTAYAHNKSNLVKKDDHVHKGDVIAYVGKTGSVSTSQLHFSIRHGRKAVNPEKYLPTLG